MQLRRGNILAENVTPILRKTSISREMQHYWQLGGFYRRDNKMKWFNRKNTIEEMATNQEQRFVIEVGHNRNNELIIKKLRVSGDDLETCITDLQSALQDFHILKVA